MNNPTPIKRDKSLVSLSKDHHDGLLLAWKTKQGIRYNIEYNRIATYLVEVFNKELEPHFIEEENLLFNKLQLTDELRIKAEQQHAAIRNKIAAFKILTETKEADLLHFAALLEEHIRFEERTLFPHIEKTLSREELDEIGRQLEEDHVNKECVVWDDEFWIKK